MKRILKTMIPVLLCLCCILTGCMQSIGTSSRPTVRPALPDQLSLDENGVPQLTVYNIVEDMNTRLDIETYIEGVLAGEMRNDWPEEALKAQAVLARTFVLRFLDTKTSMYDGADISTDVKEAQAYAPKLINDRIHKAVQDTCGQVLSYNGEFINAWFHAHAGSRTELADVGLHYPSNPEYIISTDSPDAPDAPESVQNWEVSFPLQDVEQAARNCGVETGAITDISVGETGQSGRAATLLINGKRVNAPDFRVNIGADKLKSTYIDSVRIEGQNVIFIGKGYGHGVGMSQWGAYQMAKDGKTYTDIIDHYFRNTDLVTLWTLPVPTESPIA